MASRFQPVVRRARFAAPGFSADQMLTFGQALAADVKARILLAQDVNDQPAPTLKPGYAKFKNRKYPPAIRNWQLTGRTLRGLRCLRASQNLAIIGFSDPVAAQRAAINNRRALQFGVSPKNRENIRRVIQQAQFMSVRAQAA